MQTQGIVWLASYPKSGNTWLRAFLANYLRDPAAPLPINELVGYSLGDGFLIHYERMTGRKAEDMALEEIHRLRPKMHEWMATSKGQMVYVKTHNLIAMIEGTPLITPTATVGAIYVLRNPLDVAVSYAHHYRLDMEEAVESLCRENHMVAGGPRVLPQYLGSWSQHVRSWVDAPGLKPHVMRYEDMQQNPLETFEALARFLRWPPQPARLEKAVRFSAFDELAGQEKSGGFKEQPAGGNAPFFRQGAAGGWRDELSAGQQARIIEAHGEVMRRFGYLTPAGETTRS